MALHSPGPLSHPSYNGIVKLLMLLVVVMYSAVCNQKHSHRIQNTLSQLTQSHRDLLSACSALTPEKASPVLSAVATGCSAVLAPALHTYPVLSEAPAQASEQEDI